MADDERLISSSHQVSSNSREPSHPANSMHFTPVNALNSTPRLSLFRPIFATGSQSTPTSAPTTHPSSQHGRTAITKSSGERLWQQDEPMDHALPSHPFPYVEYQGQSKRKHPPPHITQSSEFRSPVSGERDEIVSDNVHGDKRHSVLTDHDIDSQHARKRLRLPALSVGYRREPGSGMSAVLQRIEPQRGGDRIRMDSRDVHEGHHLHQHKPQLSSEVNRGNLKDRKRIFTRRTKTGCLTCRQRKKKCDEAEPVCDNCTRGNFTCLGYSFKGVLESRQSKSIAPQSTPMQDLRDRSSSGHSSSQMMVAASGCTSSPVTPLPVMEPRQILPTLAGLNGLYGSQSWPRSDRSTSLEQMHDEGRPLEYGLPALQCRDSVIEQSGSLRYAVESEVVKIAPKSTSSSCGSNTEVKEPAPLISMTEREKMLLGRPYRHYMDRQLLDERNDCQLRLEIFNKACLPSSNSSAEDIMKKFMAVVQPPAYRALHDPRGSCGSNVIVEAPFRCHYGYNIHLGDDVVIQRDCDMQDPCKISVGDRTIIGPGVRFLGMTTHMDPALRRGSQGTFYGGSITIEEDCVIGAGVQILPFRTIGKGAFVGAGTIVSKDVQANTVVAGNPMKVLRDIDDHRRDTHKRLIQQENDAALAVMVTDRERL